MIQRKEFIFKIEIHVEEMIELEKSHLSTIVIIIMAAKISG